MALTPKQKRFVTEYLVDLNATQAAIRAGYSAKRASELGYQLLQKTTVQAAVREAMEKRQARTEITQDMVVLELAKIAFANGAEYAKVVGCGTGVELKDTDELTGNQRAAIASIKEGKFGIEVKTYDKVQALELLGKHLGLFDSRSGHVPASENNLLEVILNTEEVDADDLPEVE